MTDPKAITRRLESMRKVRQPHEQIMEECYSFTHPERATGLNGVINSAQDAQSKRNRILDDTAPQSARVLSSNVVAGTTPAHSLWFGMSVGNESDDDIPDDESRWLDQASRVIFSNIHGANFDAAAYECATDIVDIGHFVLYIDEAPEGGYWFEQWPIAQCFISSSKAGGLIDTIYREVELTVEQVVTKYGIDKVSNRVAESYRNEKYDEAVKIVHAIYPRAIHAIGGKRSKNLPFASYHVEVEANHPLLESGYHEFPCVVPRWMLTPGSPYATGPVNSVLGAVRTINDIAAMELMNLDMAASGMYGAVDDGVLNPRTVKIGPRKVIIMNDKESFFPIAPGGQFNVVFASKEQLQASIRKGLLADQLQPQDGPDMTATEVHVRVQLIRQLLGPIYGRLQAEYLQPLIIRCFGIAYRAGVLGVAPPSLQGKSFTVKYISPLARAQRMDDVTAMDRLETSLIAEAQADPSVLDIYDFEAAARLRGTYLGVPKGPMRSPEDVLKLRKNKEDARQAQQQQQASMQMQQTAGEAIINKQAAA